MRKLLVAGMMLGAVQGAQAADLPILRGAVPDSYGPRVVNWEGFYVGGQASYGTADMNFVNSNRSLMKNLLNNTDIESQYSVSQWPLLGKSSQSNSGVGGFAGYNMQWEDTILGVELNYVHGKFNGQSGDWQSRYYESSDYRTTVTVGQTAAMQISDYGSFRARAGYAAGSLLPYMFGGVALGQADIQRSAGVNVDYTYIGSNNPPPPARPGFSDSRSADLKSHFVFGYSAGLGIDMMLVQNLFLRAEWEYLRFTSPVDVSINTVRAGLGYKF
ncbi:MAG: porin family protein [Rhizobiales bacterium]|nr:porin family protein [Hyphomicrobiales bacterium]MBN9013487.1 porin family protein [Hyphomicrobiales bacterium]